MLNQQTNLNRNEQIFISFNGGKDSTNEENYTCPFKCVYFTEQNSFEEIEDFIRQCKEDLKMNLTKKERNFKESLDELVKEDNLKCVVLGSRRDDPYCQHLERINASDFDKGYPSFLRINPIINWEYDQVWTFLRDFRIPYCKLYDEGYTSIGTIKDSIKNPKLKNENGNYSPAYQLQEGSKYERLSRVKE